MMTKRPTSPVLKDATVFVFDDPHIGGQAILAISADGGFFLGAPGLQATALSLEEVQRYFEAGSGSAFEMKDIVLTYVKKFAEPAN